MKYISLMCLALCSQLTLSSSAKIKPAEKKPLTVLVTGASSGIGKSTVLEFAKSEKYKVYATMRNVMDWDQPVQKNIIVLTMDVTSDESVQKAVGKVISAEGYIDVVVNNAGYAVVGCLESVHIDEAKEEFEVNVWGPVRVLQAALPHMRSARKGHIINLSSTAGIRGSPALDYYVGSKFALEGIMDSLRFTVAKYNIHITNVNPGPVHTSFGSKLPQQKGSRVVPQDPEDYITSYMDTFLDSFHARVNGQEGQTSEEVARVIVNIAILGSDDSKRSFTDVPFNIGTGRASQSVIESVKKNPTGWGGIYSDTLLAVRELSPKPLGGAKSVRNEM